MNEARVAAIDIGTNAVRLIVAEVGGTDGYRVLTDEREQTRLGLRLDETGRIAPESRSATLDALERMKQTAEGFGIIELRAVATAALREAENGPEFVEASRDRCGLEIEVISAEEEAELAMRSVRERFPLGAHPAVIVDIGGGSMEILFVTAGTVSEIHSLPVGAVRMTERFVHSDPIDAADLRSLRDEIDRELSAIATPPYPTPTMIGSGGTFPTIAALAMQDQRGETGSVQGYAMSRSEFEHQVGRLREAPLVLRRHMLGLNEDRADIILAGATVIESLAHYLDVSRIWINERGIRDGVVLEMISRL
ncbi:MAG: Ppx/GppA family phosphatase [Gemmatimonadales bacterium]|nr:MAG: Ppx/GppA family phosphatase [Gemmatimonadales bacterium]